jgi:16S rRNA (cytidine1402-2'-O)-methyltransferase
LSTLYLVATPIGNLEDLSPRALRTLKGTRLIAAEDTRHTLKLLSHFDIHTPMLSYHEHNKLSRLEEVLAALAEGDVALVSDAGTPALNDPGFELLRAVLQAGHRISPIPGPSAPVAALVASGLPTDAFLYLGYLPRRSAERRSLLGEVTDLPFTLVFLEAPHRLLEALRDLQFVLGDRSCAVARELTKLHEEIFRGRLSEAQQRFTQQEPRGEITLVVAGCDPATKPNWSVEQVQAALRAGLEAGEAPSALARQVAQVSGWDRRKIYKLISGKDHS